MTAKRYFRGPEAAELTMIIKWCMGVTGSEVINQWWQNERSRSETKDGWAVEASDHKERK
jgi:hypothetical protein